MYEFRAWVSAPRMGFKRWRLLFEGLQKYMISDGGNVSVSVVGESCRGRVLMIDSLNPSLLRVTVV
jgi:hypothetical protein